MGEDQPVQKPAAAVLLLRQIDESLELTMEGNT